MTKLPKVLVVLPADVIGGAETKTYNLISSIRGFDKVLATQSAISATFSGLGVKIYAFDDFGCTSPYLLTPGNILAYAKAIKKISLIEKPAVILGIMHNAALFVTISKDLFFTASQAVVTIEGNISAYFTLMKRKPTFQETIMLLYCFKRAKNIVVPSEGVKNDIIANWAKTNKITTIYNGIEKIKKLAKEDIPHKKDCPWVVTACRLNEQKDFSTLLRAFKIVKNESKAKLLIIGEGELRNHILNLIDGMELNDDVILTGFLQNPFPYIAKADVFVLSSFFEGFGNVLVEAMALGIPTVSTDCPSGPSEIINDGVNGFLVPVEGVREMADRCIRILKNEGLKKHLSDNGIKRAVDFSIYTMGKRFEDYFNKILGS